ncbi:alpha/beta hydrolase domain-containing protein [Terrarubrum flagellatum]|uniref:alpha/beta hydrolase domain-containing protein n=1 Tax=Terrirubrum flagellatum TaxID=2895980 RepID=UPI003144EB9E
MRIARYGAAVAAILFLAAGSAAARITRIEITKTEPAYGGQSFGAVGAYERVIGKAYGEVDPEAAANARIQDLKLAPRNAKGLVEYSTDIDILRPKDADKGNGVLLFNILNRGNKGLVNPFNLGDIGVVADMNAVTKAGDGFLERQGFTLIWFGWQADILPGMDRMTMKVPAATGPGGAPITGVVRAELIVQAATKTLNLSSGWFTGLTHDSYPTVSLDNQTPLADGFVPTLTVRAKENAPRVAIPNTEWSFAACTEGAEPKSDAKKICLPAGFQPGRIYELIYRARDPLVLGLGYAAARDLAAFLKNARADDSGAANPIARRGQKAIVMGTSQSGRFIRTFIHLGFNRGEDGERVYEGAFPHIGGGLLPLSLRFAQPGRAWGDQIDHLYPAYDFPFNYAHVEDPLTGRAQGIYDRCTATQTCPLLFHAATALEIWEGRQSLGLTDPLGLRDVPDLPSTRTYIMASTQHGPAPLPLPTAEPFGNCAQQSNPNPHTFTMRALLMALTGWVRDGVEPPPSAVPTIASGTLVSPDLVRFPAIPANAYGNVRRPAVRYLGVTNPLHPLDYGPLYDAADGSGMITVEPPAPKPGLYGLRVPQVDSDGIDVAGIRNVYLEAPIGTYTGWNLFRKERFEDGFCNFSGSFIPFARTKQERLDAGDPRLSLEERYPTPQAYAEAVKKAATALVGKRFLLQEDADLLIGQASTEGIRLAP